MIFGNMACVGGPLHGQILRPEFPVDAVGARFPIARLKRVGLVRQLQPLPYEPTELEVETGEYVVSAVAVAVCASLRLEGFVLRWSALPEENAAGAAIGLIIGAALMQQVPQAITLAG